MGLLLVELFFSQLETVHYEELMLELTLSKKHEKVFNTIS